MADQVITVEQLRQLLGVQAELREQAESRWQRAQKALVGILEAFVPEEVDRRLKSGQAMDSLGVEELAQLVSQRLNARLQQVQNIQDESKGANSLQALRDQLQANQRELEGLRSENHRLAEGSQSLKEESDRLKGQLAALQQVSASRTQPPDPNPTRHSTNEEVPNGEAPAPEWMVAWRKTETFERDAAVLRLIGETGLARRPLIEQKAAERLGIRKAGGSIRALITRLEDLHLIEVFRPWDSEGAKTGGHAPDLVRLTQYGRLAYWLLAGADPAANEYDALLVRHVSPEHTLLNLQVADVLRDAGCQVDLTPPDIHLPGGGLFKPDLLVFDPEGKTLYVEVEAEANKNREQRLAKWRNALQANGGCLYIFCDNRPCMKSVRSEINFALGRNVEQCFMTNLAELQTGKRAVDSGIWLDVRQNKAET